MRREEEREPFLERNHEFVSYDDDELESIVRRKRRASRCRLWTIVSVAILGILIIGISLFLISHYVTRESEPIVPSEEEGSVLGRYQHAAIASDSKECSHIAKEILQKKGGSSVDAAIAIMICYSTVNPMSSGIGGGFFMTIYDTSSAKAYGIDARETAPGGATEDMYLNSNASSTTGGLSIAVPGEIRGYEVAHKQFGKLPWKELFQPSITLARDGFTVSEHLADYMAGDKAKIQRDPDMREAYTNPDTGELYKRGEKIRLPKLADTMETIGEEGADAFYTGTLVKDIIADLNEKGSNS